MPRVVFGAGAMARLAEELELASLGRAFVVSTPGRSADAAAVARALGARAAGRFDGALPHVPADVVDRAAVALDSTDADVLVAVGGGSAIGLAKALALRADLPIAALPTTYSGSEMTRVWGVTLAGVKRTGRDTRAAPAIVIYDSDLTLSLPPEVSAASGMNAMAHAVEAMYAADATDEVRALAFEAARALAQALPRVVDAPRDVAARDLAFRGAHAAGAALDGASMGVHHRICHVLGGTFGLPHALTHAVVLPHVAAFNAPAAPDAMRRLAGALGGDDAPAALAALNARLGITAGLAALGLRETDIDAAAAAVADGRYPNPRPVTVADARRILLAAHRPMPAAPGADVIG
jgi:maleylacetate reductase